VKDIRDKAEALRLYVKQQDEGLEMQNAIAEIKIRAERRAGEMLAETEKNKGAATRSGDRTALPPTLGELGVTKNQSSEWQQIAEIPEDDFEDHLQTAKEDGKELTIAPPQQPWRSLGRKQHHGQKPRFFPSRCHATVG
jgi:hypothetical protein